MRTRYGLPFRNWPADWQMRWTDAITPAVDIFADDGLGGYWAPDTQIVIRKRLEMLFGYVSRNGLLGPGLPLGALLTEEVLRPWINSLRKRRIAATTLYGYVRDVRLGICAMDPDVDDRFARMVARRLESRALPARDKTSSLIHPRKIFDAGHSRAARVGVDEYEKEDVRAVQYGDGVAMMIVAASLIRLKNLVEIRIGRELQRIGDHYRLSYPANQMKSRRPFAVDLPTSLTPCLERYIERHRRQLLQGRSSEHLFISCYRGQISRQTMHIRFKAAMAVELGVELSPHRVRDLAVTHLAIEHPDKITIAPELLNHAKERTSRDHYNQADQLSAGRDYNSAMNELRRAAVTALGEGKLFEQN